MTHEIQEPGGDPVADALAKLLEKPGVSERLLEHPDSLSAHIITEASVISIVNHSNEQEGDDAETNQT